ncbi:MAG: alpha/beta hydrolase [Lachnospiraceae bacterium]|nr:alpha/beta hydrolase [Lachnospiraceae bacterium]
MGISRDNFFVTSDDAHIYYEDYGTGFPLVMIPGFLCTTKFFQKNAEVLSKEFRVILMDPRGQGYSSKTASGNTLKRHAQDIKELIEHLGLNKVILLGWSLAASTVMTFASEFNQEHLQGLVMMDGSLFPFSGEGWNHHRARNYDIENWFDNYLPLIYNPQEFYDKFLNRISNNGEMSAEDRAWIIRECRKTAPWSAVELHYDFCHTDNVSNLHKITVPAAFFGAQSKAYGLDMPEHFAGMVGGYHEVNEFYESGHLMFLFEAEKFNRLLAEFMRKAISM